MSDQEPSVSSRLPKPVGYYLNLEAGHRYRKNAQEHIAALLRDGLNMTETSTWEDHALQRAANFALVSISDAGIELVFDDNGDFKYVVT